MANEKSTNGKIIIVAVLIIVIAIVIAWYLNKKAKAKIEADKLELEKVQEKATPPVRETPVVISNQEPECIPFSQAEYTKAKNQVIKGCLPKLQIPIVGIALYKKCVDAGTGSIPSVVNC